MGSYCSYQCTKVAVQKDLGIDIQGDRIVFANLEFVNEHGHEMRPVDAIVALRKYGATIVTYPENILDPDLDEETPKHFLEMLSSGDVGFDISNDKAIAESIRLQLGSGVKELEEFLCTSHNPSCGGAADNIRAESPERAAEKFVEDNLDFDPSDPQPSIDVTVRRANGDLVSVEVSIELSWTPKAHWYGTIG